MANISIISHWIGEDSLVLQRRPEGQEVWHLWPSWQVHIAVTWVLWQTLKSVGFSIKTNRQAKHSFQCQHSIHDHTRTAPFQSWMTGILATCLISDRLTPIRLENRECCNREAWLTSISLLVKSSHCHQLVLQLDSIPKPYHSTPAPIGLASRALSPHSHGTPRGLILRLKSLVQHSVVTQLSTPTQHVQKTGPIPWGTKPVLTESVIITGNIHPTNIMGAFKPLVRNLEYVLEKSEC